MTTKLWLALLTTGLMLSTTVSARGPQYSGNRKERLQQRLDLSEAQWEKIDSIHLKVSKSTLPVLSKIKVMKAELDQLMTAENTNRNQIIKKIEEISNLKSDLVVMRSLRRQDVRDVLTEDQRIKFDQMHLKRQRPRMGHPGRTGMMQHSCQRPRRMMGRSGPWFDSEEDIEIEEKK